MGAVKNAILEAMEKSETLQEACDLLAGRGLHGCEPEDSMMQEMWAAMQDDDEPCQVERDRLDFDKILYLVEADSYAYHVEGLKLLERYPRLANHVPRGFTFEVGRLDDRPIVVTFWLYTIGDLTIAFYEATSQLVDWKMIDEWIRERYKGPKTNAMNMHNCLHEIDRQLAAALSRQKRR